MDQERLQKIKGGKLLDVIRERPAMYIGEHSLSALYHFLHGFRMALYVYDIQSAPPLPPDFHDWVAYRLHFRESTSGYRNMISKHVLDDSAALDRFFELLDEHRNRKPRLIAQVLEYQKEFSRQLVRDGQLQPEETRPFPSSLNLVSYTDDPGFFVTSEEPDSDFPRKDRFFPTLKWFGRRFGVSREELTIVDPETFNRWLRDDDKSGHPRS